LSLVFAFVFAPVGAVLGHLGLAQIKRTGQPGRDRALIGTVLSYVFIVVAVVVTVVWAVVRDPSAGSTTVAAQSSTTTTVTTTATTTTTPPPPPKVDAADIGSLLPTLDEMRRLMNTPGLVDNDSGDKITPVDSTEQTFLPPECVNSMYAFTPSVYEGSNYLSVRSVSQILRPSVNLQTLEGMATFPDVAAAQRVLANNIAQWQQCAGKTLGWHWVKENRTADFQLGPVQTVGGVTGVLNKNLPETFSARAVGAKANVVVEVQMMGVGITDEHIRTVQMILDRIPG
jgi:hypothetical protein